MAINPLLVLTTGTGLPAVTPGAATLNVIRQFLKDNGIESVATPNNALGRLATAVLPFSGNDHPGEDPNPDTKH